MNTETQGVYNEKRSNILGLVSIVVGLLQLGFGIVFLTYFITKLLMVYEEFNIAVNENVLYIFPIAIILIGLVNLVLGLLVYKSQGEKQLHNKTNAAIFLIVSFLVSVLILALSVTTFLVPMYNLSNAIK